MNDLEKIAPLFAGWEETMIWSCLQGVMGRAVWNQGRTAAAIISEHEKMLVPSGRYAPYAGIMPTTIESEKNTCPKAEIHNSGLDNFEKSGTNSARSAVAELPYSSPRPAINASRITGTVTVILAAFASAPAPPRKQKNIAHNATAIPPNTSGDIPEITPSPRALSTPSKK